MLEAGWNVMAHAQKPDFVFRRNGRVHLNRLGGGQFSRLLAAEVCASAVVMLDTPCSDVVWRVLATHSIRQFPFTSSPVRRRVPSHFNCSLQLYFHDVSREIYLLLPVDIRVYVEPLKFRRTIIILWNYFIWHLLFVTSPAGAPPRTWAVDWVDKFAYEKRVVRKWGTERCRLK